jgi:hypothetical protein
MVVEPDMEFANCRLMLPETGAIVTSLRVRNLFRITNRDGSIMLRAGCEFIHLSQHGLDDPALHPEGRTRTQRPRTHPLSRPPTKAGNAGFFCNPEPFQTDMFMMSW